MTACVWTFDVLDEWGLQDVVLRAGYWLWLLKVDCVNNHVDIGKLREAHRNDWHSVMGDHARDQRVQPRTTEDMRKSCVATLRSSGTKCRNEGGKCRATE